ncbi:aspartate/glutamate racemase family protein [Sphingopyxis sp. JAI128]|uniref:aspartate/glutamate racemase family protein n=1 Tax=Sphingopyxis sp. JAI128 TaxID=2723066 RepID=UPI0016100626|nr:arylsulfatase [Sphingopyxis sp. JAI128]MBB6427863.1 Asp/Glu/hydantoin racemase [Sphingopyxis sp. JAI128]
MASQWPDAFCTTLLDDSLSRDLAADDAPSSGIIDRFLALGNYAARSPGAEADAILFTCSAFSAAIAAVKANLSIPIVSPTEGAIEEVLDICGAGADRGRAGLILTFPETLPSLIHELGERASARQAATPDIVSLVVPDALAALQRGDAALHDDLVSAAAAELPKVDVILLGQFSLARAAAAVARARREPIVTTPESAARRLRDMTAGLPDFAGAR